MKLFRSQKGTVSVLLTLLLVPTLIISGLVTDAARIYGAKSMISDAGMLAMNAGLTQYDNNLKDNYGLMSLGVEAGSLDIEKYFLNTIHVTNATGENLSRLLDLSADSLEITAVDGSQIYQTEVEKAQILEYMKYRAPVIIAEELWDKLKEIQGAQKMIDTMEAQADFAENLEDLNGQCEDAKKKIEAYLEYEDKVSRDKVTGAKSKAETNLKNGTFHLMLGSAEYPLSDADNAMDFMAAFDAFNQCAAAFKESYNGGDDDSTLKYYFEDYILCMKYLQIMGKYCATDSALESYIKQKLQDNGMTQAGANDAYILFTQYRGILDGYRSAAYYKGLDEIKEGRNAIGGVWADFEMAKDKLSDAKKAVEKLKEKLTDVQSSYTTWTGKIDKLPASEGGEGFKEGQQKSADEYKDLLKEEDINAFLQKLENNGTYLSNGKNYLESFSYCGYKLYQANNTSNNIANAIVDVEVKAQYDDNVNTKANDFFSSNYVYPTPEFEGTFTKLKDDPFYKQLKQLCTEDSSKSGDKAESKKKADNIFSLNDFADVENEINGLTDADWSGVTRPSTLLNAKDSPDADEVEISKNGDASSKSSRKSIIKQAKESLSSMKSILTEVDNLITSGIANMYLMEYGIHMFSYYTVDKDAEGNKIESKILSMSGDDLTKHKMYKSEAEYILWGQDKAKDNVNRTRLLIYGIRFVFDLIFAFSDATIAEMTLEIATGLSCGVAFLVPVIDFVLKAAVAAAEAAFDVKALMNGKSVALLKNASNSAVKGKDVSEGGDQAFKMNYKEYLSLFMVLHMMGEFEKSALARMADCIQLNEDLDITKSYTMIAVKSNVKIRTTFLRKASTWSGTNSITNDSYTIEYKSCLGY